MYKENLVFELNKHREDLLNLIAKIDLNLSRYSKGSIFQKNNYFYLKFYENGKTVSRYLGKNLTHDQINEIELEIKNHKTLEQRRKEYKRELQ